jgi:hypothetical protein
MKTNTNSALQSIRSSRSRWNNHLANWKTYALAGGASMAAGTSADAQIVHTLVNETLSATNAISSFHFSLAGGSVFAGDSHIKMSFPPPGSYVAGVRLQGNAIRMFTQSGHAINYSRGAAIAGVGNASSIAHLRDVNLSGGLFRSQGQFGAVTNSPTRAGTVQGFVGFETLGANHDKGWIQVEVGPASNSNPSVFLTVIDYAYNSSGGPINAGDTGAVPEPGTMALALMAAGAAGLASIRRARAKFADQSDANIDRATEAID